MNPTRTLTAAHFLAEAHRNGYHGPEGLRRWAMRKNANRRTPTAYITTELVETAIALERAQLPTCPECAEVVHDADCPLVGDGRPVEKEEPHV